MADEQTSPFENTGTVSKWSRAASAEGQIASEDTDAVLIPATEVKPEDVGTLSLRYVGNVPQLVVSGGTVIPAELTVMDASGNAVAAYAARPEAAGRSQVFSTADDNQGAVTIQVLQGERKPR